MFLLAQHGFGMIERLGGITAIQSHVASMTEYLYDRMSNLRHSNGKPMLQIFGKHHFQNSREVSRWDFQNTAAAALLLAGMLLPCLACLCLS